MNFLMKLASAVGTAMRLHITPKNNFVLGDVPEDNPNSIVIENGVLSFCLGEAPISGLCSPEIVGVSITGDIFYGGITEADANAPDYWLKSAVNNPELLNTPSINYELLVNGISTGLTTSVNNNDGGPGNYSDTVLIGWAESIGSEVIGRFLNSLGGLAFINSKATESFTITFKPTTILPPALITVLKKLYKLNNLNVDEGISEAEITSYREGSLLDNNLHIGDDGSVTFCISPILTIKPFPMISCEGAIESVDAFNGIELNTFKVTVTVQYLIEQQILNRAAFDEIKPNQRVVTESFDVRAASGTNTIPLQDIVNKSSYQQYWTNLPLNRGFRMGNDGVPIDLVAIKIFIDASDGAIAYTKASGDVGAFTVSDDNKAYYACLERDNSVKSIWFNGGDEVSSSEIGLESYNGLGSDGTISIDNLTLSIDKPEVADVELVEDGDIGVKYTIKALGTAIISVHVTDKPDVKTEFLLEVYEGYKLKITNPPQKYQPQNAVVDLSKLTLATIPEGKVANFNSWKITGKGDSSLGSGSNRNNLYIGNGDNTITAVASDVGGMAIEDSFDILPYRVDLLTTNKVTVDEGGLFSLNIKIGHFKWDADKKSNEYVTLPVPDEFEVLLTYSGGDVNSDFTLVGVDKDGNYQFKALEGINQNINGSFYAMLKLKADGTNKSRSNNYINYTIRYVSPSLTASLDKSSLNHDSETKQVTLSGKLIKFKAKDKITAKIGNFNYLNSNEHKWVGDDLLITPNEDGTFKEVINVPDLYDGTVIVYVSVEDPDGNLYDQQLTFDYVAPMIFKVQAPANILVFNGSSFSKNHEIDWGDGYNGTEHVKSFTGTDIHTVKVRTRKDNSAWAQRLWVKPYKELSTGVVSDPNSTIVEVVDWGRSSYAPTVQACLGLKALPDTLPDTVTSMESFLRECSVNLPVIGNYSTTNVVNMEDCLTNNPTFNQPLNWDFSLVTKASGMLSYCGEYNQPMPYANFGSLKNAEDMFYKCGKLNQDFTTWCVTEVTATRNFAGDTLMNAVNFPVWGTCPAQPA